jgi:hypothetical protein
MTAKWNARLKNSAHSLFVEITSKNIPELHIEVERFNKKKVLLTKPFLFLSSTKTPINKVKTALTTQEI